MKEADALVRRVAKDKASASAIIGHVLDSLMALGPDMDAESWRAVALGLREAKPSMAPMFNVANSILVALEEGDDVMEGISEMREREARALERIASHAPSMEGRRFMTISYSGTVLAALESIDEKRGIEVLVPESLPMGEGRMFCRELASRGIGCETFPDSMVFAMMPSVDAVIVGADAITPAGIVNKVGTLAMCAAAARSGKAFHVLAGRSKICPVAIADLERSSTEREGVLEISQLYETFPWEGVTSIISDEGPLSPRELTGMLESMRGSGLLG